MGADGLRLNVSERLDRRVPDDATTDLGEEEPPGDHESVRFTGVPGAAVDGASAEVSFWVKLGARESRRISAPDIVE